MQTGDVDLDLGEELDAPELMLLLDGLTAWSSCLF